MVEAEDLKVRLWLASASERRLDWIEENYLGQGVEVVAIPLVDNDESEYNSIAVSEQVSLIAESKLKSAYAEIQFGRLEQIFKTDLGNSEIIITIVKKIDNNTIILKNNENTFLVIEKSQILLVSFW